MSLIRETTKTDQPLPLLPIFLSSSVGMRSVSTNSQGFHGIQRDFTGVVSNTLTGQNIMFRVSGDIIIPVELLEFEVE